MKRIYWVARDRDGSLNIFNNRPSNGCDKWLIRPSKTRVCFIIPIIKLIDANAFNNVEFSTPVMFGWDYIFKVTGINVKEVLK